MVNLPHLPSAFIGRTGKGYEQQHNKYKLLHLSEGVAGL